jgi:hypothetical protein
MKKTYLPTTESLGAIYDSIDYHNIVDFLPKITPFSISDIVHANGSISLQDTQIGYEFDLLTELGARLTQITKNYIYLIFYYDQGFIDQNHISMFYQSDLSQYDYHRFLDYVSYSDSFYRKLASVYDVIGHYLNFKFNLELDEKNDDFTKKPNFDNILKWNNNLHNNKQLFYSLVNIKKKNEFKLMKDIRHNLTHNFTPFLNLQLNSPTKKTISTKEVFENQKLNMDLLRKTIKFLTYL